MLRRLALPILIASMTGCAASPPPAPKPEPDLLAIAPLAMGRLGGLETRVWTVSGDPASFDSALLATLQRGAVERLDLYEEGFRVIEMPVADAARLWLSMRSVGPSHQAWFGQVPVWTEIARGPRVEGGAWASVGGRVTPLLDGRLRILARAWTSPSPDGPALTVELLPQLADTSVRFTAPDPARTGLVFPGISFAGTLAPGRALVVLGEAPGAEWTAVDQENDQGQVSEAGSDSNPAPLGPAPGGVGSAQPSEPIELPPVLAGPRQALPPTVGELTLGAGEVRVVLVLVPRLPERVELTGGR